MVATEALAASIVESGAHGGDRRRGYRVRQAEKVGIPQVQAHVGRSQVVSGAQV
jgi:hypothetical protein